MGSGFSLTPPAHDRLGSGFSLTPPAHDRRLGIPPHPTTRLNYPDDPGRS
jgi:hypothetical protein